MRPARGYNPRRSETSRMLRHVGATVHDFFCCFLTYSQINADSDDNRYSANTMLLREDEIASSLESAGAIRTVLLRCSG